MSGGGQAQGVLRLLLLLPLALSSCLGPEEGWDAEVEAPDRYQTLSADEEQELRRVVAALEGGRPGEALELCDDLAARNPDDLATAVWRQEALTLQLERRRGTDPERALAALRERYRSEAEEQPGALAWYLAARIDEEIGRAHV